MIEDILDLFSDGPEDVVLGNASEFDGIESPGEFQAVALDFDGDGSVDQILLGVDLDNDGVLDQYWGEFDIDGDGLSDGLFSISATPLEDGLNGIHVEAIADIDGDGRLDMMSFADLDIGEEVSGQFSVFTDFDGDQVFEAEQTFLINDGAIEVIDNGAVGSAEAYEQFNPHEADMQKVVGNPVAYMDNWHCQETDFSCAVVAQEFAIEELLGIDIDEADMRQIAFENGWLTENGTTLFDIGKLMEHMGLNVERSFHNTLADLCSCLEKGCHPVVGVDADELWSGENEELFMPGRDANHAIQVIGVDFSDPDEPMVIINDSGVANGCGAMVSAELFMDAWEDSGCYMVEAYA